MGGRAGAELRLGDGHACPRRRACSGGPTASSAISPTMTPRATRKSRRETSVVVSAAMTRDERVDAIGATAFKDDPSPGAVNRGPSFLRGGGYRGAALELWMNSHEGFDRRGVQVRWLGPERGFGAVATTRAIPAGDVIVRVPRSAMLTADEARFCRNVGRAARQLTEWQALTLKLLHERDRYLDESSLGGSAWDEWIEMLPDLDIMRELHPLMWTAVKRRKLLQGSPTLTRLEAMIDQSTEDRQSILKALGVDVTSSGPSSATAWPSHDEVLWAGAVIYSRAFQLSLKPEESATDPVLVSEGGFQAEMPAGNNKVSSPAAVALGPQSMVQRGALWWSVEENLEDDGYDSNYDEEDEEVNPKPQTLNLKP